MKLKLPKISSTKEVGTKNKKNYIVHFIEKEQEIFADIISQENTNVILKDKEGIDYFITSNKQNIPNDKLYVIWCQNFTEEDIENENIITNRWLKHPKIKEYTSQEICDSWKNKFSFKKEDQLNNIIGLRNPQIGAIFSILGHLTNAKDIATVVLPTGTGKTETMLSVLVANQCNKLLVTVPSDSLREQLSQKFYNLGLLKLKDLNGDSILHESAMLPKVGILNTGFDSIEELQLFFNQCNVIISTMDLMTKSLSTSLQREVSNLCTHLFVDEAHHSKANNWNKFIKLFGKEKVILFTATPYRNDGKLLDGKTIYNFSLKEAQQEGYFKVIDFLPIREYDQVTSDNTIAEVAVNKLREDIRRGFDHILMARCENKNRAREVFKIYSKYADLNPVIIHSSINNKNNIKHDIIEKKHKIIVCVDMLGEGFDLPELKVAAFHDVRKSLPVTLQFIGRFTRTSRDSNLGNASFIANLYQPKIEDVLSLLYMKDSNWNTILPSLTHQSTQEQINLQEFLSDFQYIENSIIPYQDIRPAFSVVVYKNYSNQWSPMNFYQGIKGYDNYDYKFYDINSNKHTLVIFLGSKKNIDWGNFKDVYNIEWNVFIIYWEQSKNALFIHSSEKGSDFKDLAKAIIGDKTTLLQDENVFKAFHNLDRIRLFNVGLRKGLGKDITFQSYYGKGVQDALSEIEEKSSVNNNVFGVGFEEGKITSIGCSRKGRIWSYSRGTINELIDWCDKLSLKLFDPNIIAKDILLKNTIQPLKVETRPQNLFPISADWHKDIYKETESRTIINIQNNEFDLSSLDINVFEPSLNDSLKFSVETDKGNVIFFEQQFSVREVQNEYFYSFKINKLSKENVSVRFGSKFFANIEDFFEQYPPIYWFTDGSCLQGYEYIKFNEEILLFPKNDIIAWEWEGVELRHESEKFDEVRTDSIQYFCFQKFLQEDYDILYNDDDSGEIADIITIKDLDETIEVEFYHLKFALDGKVSNQIKNFYEVCGQTQKSLVWKYKEDKEFFDHLIRREIKKNKDDLTRLKKGKIEDLENLLNLVKRNKIINFNITIIQPALSKQNVSDNILTLLGVTANHLKKEGNISLRVIGSE